MFAQHLLYEYKKHSNEAMEDILEVLHTTRKESMMNSLEKFHIYIYIYI